jgi:ElaB/YqjD/DUF883 family membrane-anchored ribosome-binding protein
MAEARRTEQMLEPDQPALDPERELPPATTRTNPALNEAAEAIGGALGGVTRQVQKARDRFQVIRGGGVQGGLSASEQLKHGAQEKMQAAQEKVGEIRKRAGTAVEQARIQAEIKLEEARAKASRMAREARERARVMRQRAAHLTAERPLAVLAGIGAAAFLLGIFLRVGRGKRG